MLTYILRRLLLMIPTLFGVTIVSFLVMQLAPGDPLLQHGGGDRSDKEASRESYLVQKRALGLDKPLFVNINAFRDYHEGIRQAAQVLGSTPANLMARLPGIATDSSDGPEYPLRRFLSRLNIPDFETRLNDPEHYPGLAKTIVDFVQVWCEDAGASAMPTAMSVLAEKPDDLAQRRGVIRVLNNLVRDPFTYTYSRNPDDSQTPAIVATWKLWWDRQRDEWNGSHPPLSADRRQTLDQTLTKLSTAPSRNELMTGLEGLQRDDVGYFAETLLGQSTLAEKNVSALALRLFADKPLETDVPLDAERPAIDLVAQNWETYYGLARSQYEPTTTTKVLNVLGDTQYSKLLWRLVTFNFGPSAMKTREPVGEKIWQAFKVTAPLMLASEVLIYLIAIPLGIICAVNRGKLLDRLISFGLFLLYSVPTFVAAMIFLLLFCYGDYVHWFPMAGLHSDVADQMSWGMWLVDYAWHAFLPIVCLSIFSLAGLAMYARASMLDVISADYIRTARAKGVAERNVIWRHALRNAMIPVITLFADFLPAMLGGSVLVEVLFAIPGMGRLSWTSLSQKDYPTLMALLYIDAILVLLSLLLSDILYSVVDPRISLDASAEVD